LSEIKDLIRYTLSFSLEDYVTTRKVEKIEIANQNNIRSWVIMVDFMNIVNILFIILLSIFGGA